jgi:hypothetical protein
MQILNAVCLFTPSWEHAFPHLGLVLAPATHQALVFFYLPSRQDTSDVLLAKLSAGWQGTSIFALRKTSFELVVYELGDPRRMRPSTGLRSPVRCCRAGDRKMRPKHWTWHGGPLSGRSRPRYGLVLVVSKNRYYSLHRFYFLTLRQHP